MADEPTSAEIAAQRAEFLANPPEVIDPDAGNASVTDDAALEAAALDELTKAPAAPEGAATPPAPSPAPAAAGPDPYAAYGGEEQVRLAWQVQEAMRTEQGVRALVANGLTALGYDPQQIAAALNGQAPAPAGEVEEADPLAGFDDDDPVPAGSVRALIQQAVAEAVAQATEANVQQVQPLADLLAQQQQQQVHQSTDAALIAVLGPLPTEDPEAEKAYRSNVDAIVERAQRYYDGAQATTPGFIQGIIARANAELVAESEARFQAYLQTKKHNRDLQPVHTGGGAGGEAAPPEPRNLAEARKQAAAAGFFDA